MTRRLEDGALELLLNRLGGLCLSALMLRCASPVGQMVPTIKVLRLCCRGEKGNAAEKRNGEGAAAHVIGFERVLGLWALYTSERRRKRSTHCAA